jgi:ATP-dependent Lhr-like helicase
VYPFEGRAVHEGIASLVAFRLARRRPLTVHVATNDHGFELLAPPGTKVDWPRELDATLFVAEGLVDDVMAGVNVGELARRRFRDVARVAGFINPGLPYAPKSARQLQASSGLLYDVLVRYDPDHLLLAQARREVVEQHLEQARMEEGLARLRDERIEWVETAFPTPLAMPLLIERLSVDGHSTEPIAAKLERLQAGWAQ